MYNKSHPQQFSNSKSTRIIFKLRNQLALSSSPFETNHPKILNTFKTSNYSSQLDSSCQKDNLTLTT
jgi:hypothetical protein